MAKKGRIKNVVELVDEEVRPVRSRRYVYFVLIVCEDQNTEPAYFKQFEDLFNGLYPEETVYVKRVGTGRNSLGVLNAAIAERSRIFEENNHRQIDETWVVFDKDDLDKSPGNRQNFEMAFTVANEQNINVAYSNECFELWLLLHFIDVNPNLPIAREEIYKMLEVAVNASLPEGEDPFSYTHGAASVVEYAEKFGDETAAINRAVVLQAYHESNSHCPIESNPVTYVDKIVKSLRDWYRYYTYDNDNN